MVSRSREKFYDLDNYDPTELSNPESFSIDEVKEALRDIPTSSVTGLVEKAKADVEHANKLTKELESVEIPEEPDYEKLWEDHYKDNADTGNYGKQLEDWYAQSTDLQASWESEVKAAEERLKELEAERDAAVTTAEASIDAVNEAVEDWNTFFGGVNQGERVDFHIADTLTTQLKSDLKLDDNIRVEVPEVEVDVGIETITDIFNSADDKSGLLPRKNPRSAAVSDQLMDTLFTGGADAFTVMGRSLGDSTFKRVTEIREKYGNKGLPSNNDFGFVVNTAIPGIDVPDVDLTWRLQNVDYEKIPMHEYVKLVQRAQGFDMSTGMYHQSNFENIRDAVKSIGWAGVPFIDGGKRVSPATFTSVVEGAEFAPFALIAGPRILRGGFKGVQDSLRTYVKLTKNKVKTGKTKVEVPAPESSSETVSTLSQQNGEEPPQADPYAEYRDYPDDGEPDYVGTVTRGWGQKVATGATGLIAFALWLRGQQPEDEDVPVPPVPNEPDIVNNYFSEEVVTPESELGGGGGGSVSDECQKIVQLVLAGRINKLLAIQQYPDCAAELERIGRR